VRSRKGLFVFSSFFLSPSLLTIFKTILVKIVVSNKGKLEMRLDEVRQYVKGRIVRCEGLTYVCLKAKKNANGLKNREFVWTGTLYVANLDKRA